MGARKAPTLFAITLLYLYCIEKCAAFHLPKREKSSTLGCRFKHLSVRENKEEFTRENGRRLMSNLPSDNDDEDAESASWMWIATLVLPLQLVYVSNQWSRSSIYYLVNFSEGADPFRAMNVAVGFSEAQYGLLASLAFTALFAVASLGAGVAADKYNRKNLTIFAAIGWSVATLGTSLSSTYSEVLGWRVVMGLACAFATPTAYTLINERVPKDRVSFATSLYGTGGEFLYII
jgi:hypothetical protein